MVKDKIVINKLELATRIVMPPMATNKGNYVSDELCKFYAERSENDNVGLIITEHSYVDKRGIASINQLSMADDESIEGFSRLAKTIHEAGNTKAIVQINHAGGNADSGVFNDLCLAPSDMDYRKGKARSMTIEEINDVRNKFIDAAYRVKQCGFDGVEIHCAHGYLLNQFYSPLCNKRTDEYGCQNIENRTRLLIEIIKGVREKVGDDFVISVRLGGCDYGYENGSTLQDCLSAAKLIKEAKADLLSLTGGLNGFVRKDANYPGYFKDMSKIVKDNVDITVLLTGGITSYEQAEQLLNENVADLIGIGRALLTNPNL